MKEQIIPGKWTRGRLDNLLKEASTISDPGERTDFLSKQFLDTPYKASTLIGDVNTPEVFVINLKGVDCFTFIEYIDAMRISGSFAGYKNNLKKTRYRAGNIVFENRNHFFSDWREFNSDLIEDVTEYAGAGKSVKVSKRLNKKDDGTYFIPGVPCMDREIVYIPSKAVDDAVIEKLKTGDYIGIYSEKQELDVSHVGIVIKDKSSVLLRHASSSKDHGRVIDQDFKGYIAGKPGIVVLRPRELHS